MSKDTMNAARDGRAPQKRRVSKAATAKSKPKRNKSKASTKAAATAPTKAAVEKAAKNAAMAVAKTATKTAAAKPKVPAKPTKTDVASKPVRMAPPSKPSSAKPRASTKATGQGRAAAPVVPSLGRSLQAAVPAAVAVNTKLVDIAQANVSAGLELARDLAGAKTPMEAMQLGVAYWFNHIGAVQAQARELQSLSAAWVRTAGEQNRAG